MRLLARLPALPALPAPSVALVVGALLALLALLASGCGAAADAPDDEPPVVEAAEITPPAAPGQAGQPTPDPDGLVPSPAGADGAGTRPDAAVRPPADTPVEATGEARPSPSELPEPTVVEMAEELGLDGLIALLADDPDAAGDKGEDLLKELRRVDEDPRDNRIRRAIERTQKWLDDSDVDREVGQAAIVVLLQLSAEAQTAGHDGDAGHHGEDPEDDREDD